VRQIINRDVFDKAVNKPQSVSSIGFASRETLTRRKCTRCSSRRQNAYYLSRGRAKTLGKVYEHGEFASASAGFELLGECDRASRVLLERCRDLMAAPTRLWDGTYQFKEK
jgi:hypothetical protein